MMLIRWLEVGLAHLIVMVALIIVDLTMINCLIVKIIDNHGLGLKIAILQK